MNTKKYGFSLIELVVAITIGGIVLTSVMGSFLTLSKMRQQLDVTRQIQREINFAVIRIADRIRSQEIYYSPTDPTEYDLINDHYVLPLGKESLIDIFEYDGTEKLTMNEDSLFSSNLKVTDCKFTVSPETDTGPKPEQPRVHIELIVSDKSGDTSIPLRTTISSRLIQ